MFPQWFHGDKKWCFNIGKKGCLNDGKRRFVHSDFTLRKKVFQRCSNSEEKTVPTTKKEVVLQWQKRCLNSGKNRVFERWKRRFFFHSGLP